MMMARTLEEVIRKYEHGLNNIPGAVLVKQSTADKSYHVWANQSLCNLIGYKHPSKAYGISDADVRCDAAEKAELFYDHDRQIMTGIEMNAIDLFNYCSEDTIGIHASKGPYRNDYGEIVGVICVVHKITRMMLGSLNLDLLKVGDSSPFNKSYVLREALSEFNLTVRESQNMFYLIRNFSTQYIANELEVSKRTVDEHVDNIKRKLGLGHRREVIDFAFANGLLHFIPVGISWRKNSLVI